MKSHCILRLCLAAAIIMGALGIYSNVHAEKTAAAPGIWNNLPQDILLAVHFRSTDPVEFYNKIYGYLTDETRKEFDKSIAEMQKETSLKFKEEFLPGLKGQYTLIILGNLDSLDSNTPPEFAFLQSMGNILFALQPNDYKNFEKIFNSIIPIALKDKKDIKITLPAPNESTPLQVPEAKLPFELLIYRDNKNTFFIGLKEAIEQIKSVQAEKVPAVSSLPTFKNTFQHFRQKGDIIIQAVVNPQKVADIIEYATKVAGVADEQTQKNLDAFSQKFQQSSTLLAFQATSFEDLILTESTIPSALYDMYYWLILSNMGEGLHRGKQSKTIANMRTLSTGLEIYFAENNAYPPAKKKKISGTVEEVLKSILEESNALSNVPLVDGWGNPFYYEKTDAQTYTLTSYGSDGKAGKCAGEGKTKSYADDLVVTAGQFTCSPKK